MDGRRINIGSGGRDLQGYEPWDLADGRAGYPLDVADDSLSEIYASHVLEHFSHRATLAVLQDWHRALAPGGRLRVAVPDFDAILDAYITQAPGANVEGWLFGGHTDGRDVHAAMFTAAKLRALLSAAGFVDIAPFAPEIADCSALPVSLNLSARKPADAATVPPAEPATMPTVAVDVPPPPPPPAPARKTYRAAAVWTTPRLGFMATFDCIYSALPPLGIPLVRAMGAFWGQGMETGMARAIAEYAPEYIVTLDYDSVFGPEDLAALLDLADAHPEAAAVCPHQWHRVAPKPLWTPIPEPDGTLRDVTAAELAAGPLFEVGTAHFGLSVIRASALAAMPHPWFLPTPAPDGTWGDGKTDDDIHFWRAFRAAGNRVYLAPAVTIGHVQECVVWPGSDLAGRWQNLSEWHSAGRPEGLFGAL